MANGYVAWNIYLNGRLIDTVFYNPDCDREYVRDGLINHDGYDSRIKVYKARW
jgi:hypothetical protein